MKYLFFLLALAISATLPAAPSAYDSVQKSKLIEWVEQLRAAANSAKSHADEAEQKLTESQTTLSQTKKENLRLQGDIEKLTEWGVFQQKAAIKAQQDLDHVLKKLHFLKWIFSALAALSVFLLIWKWSPPLTTPYAVAIYILPPLLAFGAVWTFL